MNVGGDVNDVFCDDGAMSASAERMWNGVTTPDRRADRRRRLLDAGVDIMGTHGLRALTVRTVCRATRVSERHFYQEFTSKDEFALAIYDHVIDDAFTVLTDTAAAGVRDGAAALDVFVGAWIDFVAADPRRGRIIAVEAAHDRALAHRGRQVASTMMRIVLGRRKGTSDGFGDRGARADMEVTATVIVSGVWALLLAWLDDALEVTLTREELVERVVALIARATA